MMVGRLGGPGSVTIAPESLAGSLLKVGSLTFPAIAHG